MRLKASKAALASVLMSAHTAAAAADAAAAAAPGGRAPALTDDGGDADALSALEMLASNASLDFMLEGGGAGARDGGAAPSQHPERERQQQTAAASAAPAPPTEEPVALGPTGRPQRKRRPAMNEDMIPTDILMRRGPKARALPGQEQPSRSRPSHQQSRQRLPASGLPPGTSFQLVTVNTPDGSTRTGLALPAAALAQLQQQQAQRPPPPPPGPVAMPYKLVPPPLSADTAPPLPPAVRVAGPRDVVQMARQLDQQERHRALMAADARVALRVLPGGQYSNKPFPVPKPRRPSGSRRSGARPSQRPAFDAYGHGGDLSPGSWHPGFESHEGVTLVSVAQAPAAPGLAALAAGGEAQRMAQPPLIVDPHAQLGASGDPVAASLDYLHHAARTAGQTPQYASASYAAAVVEEHGHRELLARAHFARDGRAFPKERLEGTRKSVRVRAYPEVLGPGGPRPSRPPRPEDATDVRLGSEHQAPLPPLRPRLDVPMASEARFLAGLACSAGEVEPPSYDAQQAAAMPAASAQERAAWVDAAHEALRESLGPQRAAALGLGSMGAVACAPLLTAGEEAALEAGMREFGRAFHTIRAERLPQRTVFDLQNYYFNVWKLRATPAAAAWYVEKAAEEARRQAEIAKAEQAAEREEEERRQRQEARQKRRSLREAVQWVKTAARSPAELPHNRPTVVLRAQRAASILGSLDSGAVGGLAPPAPAAVEIAG